VYDAAHVLGLIAGKQFQDPFREGAEVMTTSTHKTFPGPQGGLIMSNNEEKFKLIRRALFPGLVCNHHIHRLPALAMACNEMMEFDEKYAHDTIDNAKVLAADCESLGFEVLSDGNGIHTQSHQVVLDLSGVKHTTAVEAASRCEDAGIILNKNMIPGDTSPNNPSGLRIGTQEMTHFGMGENEMCAIAEMLTNLILYKHPVSEIKAQAEELRAQFQEVKYC
jgi:glycine hydroxymethyltransferase